MRNKGQFGGSSVRGSAPLKMSAAGAAVKMEDHTGLVFKAASWAADRYGGAAEDWAGAAYEAMAHARRTFRASRNCKWSTHAMKTMQWKLYTESMIRSGFKRTGSVNDRKVGCAWYMVSREGMRMHQQRIATEPPSDAVLELAERARGVVDELSERDRLIIDLRMRGFTLEQVARETGLCRERVRQVLREVAEKVTELGAVA